jgi:hypothetical protein
VHIGSQLRARVVPRRQREGYDKIVTIEAVAQQRIRCDPRGAIVCRADIASRDNHGAAACSEDPQTDGQGIKQAMTNICRCGIASASATPCISRQAP